MPNTISAPITYFALVEYSLLYMTASNITAKANYVANKYVPLINFIKLNVAGLS